MSTRCDGIADYITWRLGQGAATEERRGYEQIFGGL